MEEMLFEGSLWFYYVKIVKSIYRRPLRVLNTLKPLKSNHRPKIN
ncbi:conserved hypothetical protein [delta proteobacterium NaphS2]|nr:conserved hypothetical protein [delta proteobacterium NaphS2]